MKIKSNGIELDAEVHPPQPSPAGEPADRAETVLLIMGLGQQRVVWPRELIQPLCESGYRVVTFDNRDVGLSTHFDEVELPNMPWQFVKHRLGFTPTHPYTLQDMALDALGLLDALGVAQAHVVGVSMGGMIAQRMAATHPQRVLSLTSIMSSSGAPGLPGPRSDVARYLMSRPASFQPADLVAHAVGLVKLIGGTAYAGDVSHVHDRVLAAARRRIDPRGVVRQTLAVVSDADRHTLLPTIRCPALVIHGTADPLVPLACGEDTARRIPGARFHTVDGMGHDWPPALMPVWLQWLLPHLRAARSTSSPSP